MTKPLFLDKMKLVLENNNINKMKTRQTERNILNDRKYVLIVVILIFIIGGGILGYFLNKKEPVLVSQKEDTKKEEVQKGEEPAPVIPTPPEEKWVKYISSELGFSIEYPEMVYGIYKCSPKKPFYVPLKVFEDNENGIVYITEEYYYNDWDNETQSNTGSCKKIINSLEYLKSQREITIGINDKASLNYNPFLTKVFVIKDIKDDIELDEFIKDNYGSGCFANSKKLLGENGVYEIEIEGEDWNKGTDLGTTTCPINYVYKVLYAPEKNKAMSVNLGQECGFGTQYISEESYKCYDHEMIDGFKFSNEVSQDENNEVTYKTFSSPKADFTFEYPDTWVYEEKTDQYNPNATGWSFYLNSEKIPENLILAVISPLTEIVDFCSNGTRESLYQLNIFSTNDPETFVTY